MIYSIMKTVADWKMKHYLLAAALFLLITATGLIYWASRNMATLVEAVVKRSVGAELQLGRIETGWNRIVLHEIRIPRKGPGNISNRLYIGKATLTPSFKALFSRKIEIGLIRLDNLFVLVEIGPDGRIIAPIPPVKPSSKSTSSPDSGFQLTIGSVEIDNGTLAILDNSKTIRNMPGLSNPQEGFHLVRFSEINLRTGRFDYPVRNANMKVKLSVKTPERGTLNMEGIVNLDTLDSKLKLILKDLDITRFRPYYQNPGDITVTSGLLDGNASITIANKRLHAPGEVRLKALSMKGQGLFLGMPANVVLAFLKNSKDEIAAPFTLAGDINNPQFKIHQSLVNQIATGIAAKIGIPIVSDITKGLINLGGKGFQGLGKMFGGK
jgi:Domain of Unknown Function (DUF748)